MTSSPQVDPHCRLGTPSSLAPSIAASAAITALRAADGGIAAARSFSHSSVRGNSAAIALLTEQSCAARMQAIHSAGESTEPSPP